MKAGASLKAKSMLDGNALHYASRAGKTDIVRILLDAGMDANEKVSGKTAWMLAEANGHAETAALLSGKGSPDIFQAAQSGSLDTVRQLLEKDKSLAKSTKDGNYTLLHAAARSGNAKLVVLLLDSGADIDAYSTDSYMTALHIAAEAGHEEIIKVLLKRGADVNGCKTHERNEGFTPLHTASMSGWINIMNMLIEHGADLSLVDEAGNTALDWANEAESENWKEAARLLKSAMSAGKRK
jgi:ankyrin repeat protein